MSMIYGVYTKYSSILHTKNGFCLLCSRVFDDLRMTMREFIVRRIRCVRRNSDGGVLLYYCLLSELCCRVMRLIFVAPGVSALACLNELFWPTCRRSIRTPVVRRQAVQAISTAAVSPRRFRPNSSKRTNACTIEKQEKTCETAEAELRRQKERACGLGFAHVFFSLNIDLWARSWAPT